MKCLAVSDFHMHDIETPEAGAYGRDVLETDNGHKVDLINASICDESYQPKHKQVLLEIDCPARH